MNVVTSSDSVHRPAAQLALVHLIPVLLAYFGIQLIIRTLTSDSLELDEAEQVLWTQRLAWGYGEQPPLYTWLQRGVFELFGTSVFSLALLKNALLAGTYTFTFLAARQIVRPPLAIFAAASLLLLPQISWESQRDLTHSVLMTMLASATLYVTLQLIRRPHPLKYVALGAVIGLGMLSKYSYVLFVTALALAVLISPSSRHVWRSPWVLVSLLVAALVVSPHLAWLMEHAAEIADKTADKLDPDERASGISEMIKGVGSLVSAAVSFLALWGVAMLAVFGRSLWRGHATSAERIGDAEQTAANRSLWKAYFGVLLVLLLGMVVIGGVSHFKDRWMQPLLFCAPLALFSCLPQLALHRRLKWLAGLAGVMAVVVMVMISLRPYMSGARENPGELNLPVAELAAALRKAGYDGHSDILTSDRVLGGTLKLQFPYAEVHVGTPADASGPLLVIEKSASDAAVLGLLAKARPSAVLPFQTNGIVLNYRNSRPAGKRVGYRYLLLAH